MCDLRALTRAALLEALSQYPGDKEPKGQLQGVKTPQVALEWQRWDDVFFFDTSIRKCPEEKPLVGWFLFSKHLAVFPNLCQKKSWLKWNQEKAPLSELIVEEGNESLILKPQVRLFLLWLFHFLELKDFVSESQQQSGKFSC